MINAAAGEDAAATLEAMAGALAATPATRPKASQLPRKAPGTLHGTLNAMTVNTMTHPRHHADVLTRPPFRGKLLIDGTWGRRRRRHRSSAIAPGAWRGRRRLRAGRRRRCRAGDRRGATRPSIDGPWPHMKGAERARILLRSGRPDRGAPDELALHRRARERQADRPGRAARSPAPPTSGTMPRRSRATCTATATTRWASPRSASCCASRSASSRSSRRGTSRS